MAIGSSGVQDGPTIMPKSHHGMPAGDAFDVAAPSCELDELSTDTDSRTVEALAITGVLAMQSQHRLTGAGATIAVLDSGVRSSHVKLRVKGGTTSRIVAACNVTDGNLGSPEDVWDEHGHGTHVAGIVADTAPGANLAVVKVLRVARQDRGLGKVLLHPVGPMKWVAAGLSWVLRHHQSLGISVVCLSAGAQATDDAHERDAWRRVRERIQLLSDRAVAVVVAAGNRGAGDIVERMDFPATVERCISVGAAHSRHKLPTNRAGDGEAPMQIMAQSKRRARRNGVGTTLFAPGDQVPSAGVRSDRQRTAVTGTSQAAPIVAGAIAMLQQRWRDRAGTLPSVDQLVQWLTAGATQVDLAGRTIVAAKGEGLLFLNMRNAVHELDGDLATLLRANAPGQLVPFATAALAEVVQLTPPALPLLPLPPPLPLPPLPSLLEMTRKALYQAPCRMHVEGSGHPEAVQSMFHSLYRFVKRPFRRSSSSGPEIEVTFRAREVGHWAPGDSSAHLRIVSQKSTNEHGDTIYDGSVAATELTPVLLQIGWALVQQLLESELVVCRTANVPSEDARFLHDEFVRRLDEVRCLQQWPATLASGQSVVGVLVVFVEPSFDDNLKARSEIIEAKRRGAAILLVHTKHQMGHVRDRALPYAGNAEVISEPPHGDDIAVQVLQLLVKQLHFRRRLNALSSLSFSPHERVDMIAPPQLIDCMFVNRPIIYPDPPMTRPESVLLQQFKPKLRTATPTILSSGTFAGNSEGLLRGSQVSLSMSQPDDLAEQGLLAHHVHDAIVDIARHLVMLGAKLSYGGIAPELPVDKSTEPQLVEGSERNYTELLVDLVKDYSARTDFAGRIRNYRVVVPAAQPASPPPTGGLESVLEIVPISPQDRSEDEDYRYSRGLDAMRATMARTDHAQIVLGGKRASFNGRYPALLQEVFESVRQDGTKPIYLVGGFGGLARYIAELAFGELLAGRSGRSKRLNDGDDRVYTELDEHADWGEPRLTDQALLSRGGNREWRMQFAHRVAQYGDSATTTEEMCERIKEWGAKERADASTEATGNQRWSNGLTTEENITLATTRIVPEIVTLILTGLLRTRSNGLPTVPLRICRGSIGADEVRAEVYMLAMFSDLDIVGPATVVDRRLGGAVQRALLKEQLNLGRGEAKLIDCADGAVCFIGLGRSTDWFELDGPGRQHVLERAVYAGMERCFAAGLGSISTVLMGAGTTSSNVDTGIDTLPLSVAEVLGCIVRAARYAWSQIDYRLGLAGITICEINIDRFNQLHGAVAGDPDGFHFASEIEVTQSAEHMDEPATLVVDREGDGCYRWKWVSSVGAGALFELRRRPEPRALSELLMKLGDARSAWLAHDLTALLWDQAEDKPTTALSSFASLIAANFASEPHPRAVTVVCPPDAAHLPFEALAFGPAEATSSFPALAVPMVRRLATEGRRDFGGSEWLSRARLQILMVVPDGTLPAARREIWAVGDAFSETEVLREQDATVERIMHELDQRHYDVLHFAGHAFYDEITPSNSGFLCHGREILAASHLKQSRSLPRLAFINACESARIQDVQLGLPPTAGVSGHQHGGFAEQLLHAGLNNYIGAQWPVRDDKAIVFAEVLYGQLAQGDTLGESMLAARRAAKALDGKWNLDWASYICYGWADLRLRRPPTEQL